jgi:hypothetical protein
MSIKTVVDQLLGEAEDDKKGKSVDRDAVIDFLTSTPDPTPEATEEFIESNGYDYVAVANVIYSLATKAAKFLRGGKSKGNTEGFDSKELAAGVKTESDEHVDDEEFARKIASDHLTEFSNYYTGPGGLADMEKNLKGSGKDEK